MEVHPVRFVGIAPGFFVDRKNLATRVTIDIQSAGFHGKEE
jgi:hypothetical protein